jgi:hypothetical protein
MQDNKTNQSRNHSSVKLPNTEMTMTQADRDLNPDLGQAQKVAV